MRKGLWIVILISLERELIILSLVKIGTFKETLQDNFILLLSWRKLFIAADTGTFIGNNSLLLLLPFSVIFDSRIVHGEDVCRTWYLWLLELPVTKVISLLHFLYSEFLLVIVVLEVVIEACRGSEALEDSKHSFTGLWVDFLTVSSLACWLVLVQRILDVDELSVRDVLDINPFDFEWPRPFFWLFPQVCMVLFVVNSCNHFGNSTKVLWFVHAEQEMNLCFSYSLLSL